MVRPMHQAAAGRVAGFAAGLLLAASVANAQGNPDEGVRPLLKPQSVFMKSVPADGLEQASAQRYRKDMQDAAAKHALMPSSDPQVVRLRAIADRILPFTPDWNPRAADWNWEVNLLKSDQINAYCAPGGKIVFYTALLSEMQLSDDEVAEVMGHEIAHALREHVRQRIAKGQATQLGAGALANMLGLGNMGTAAMNGGVHLLGMKFSREEESEADMVGSELAARAGYDPRQGAMVFQKFAALGHSKPEILSDHPSDARRVAQLAAIMPRVEPIYQRAPKPDVVYGPPPRPAQAASGGKP